MPFVKALSKATGSPIVIIVQVTANTVFHDLVFTVLSGAKIDCEGEGKSLARP